MKKMEVKEIGSEFSLPSEYLREKPTHQFEKYAQYPRKVFLISGRGALKLVAMALKLGKKDEVLLPSYLCEEVVRPFREEHVKIKFYAVDKTLNVDLCDIESKIGPDTKALLFIHYFGFPQPAMKKIRSICEDNNVFLIEDLVQSFLTTHQGKPLGSVGDVTVSSYRKWIPVPDGALLGINNSSFHVPPIKKTSRKALVHVAYRMEGLKLKGSYLKSPTFPKHKFRKIFGAAEKFLGTTPVEMSGTSRKMLSRFDFNAIINRRRKNFQRLIGNIESYKSIEPIYKKLPKGVCPFRFPILVKDRGPLRDRLIKNEIYPSIHWELLGDISKDEFPVSWQISNEILTIPIDQRYDTEDMDFIVKKINEFEAR